MKIFPIDLTSNRRYTLSFGDYLLDLWFIFNWLNTVHLYLVIPTISDKPPTPTSAHFEAPQLCCLLWVIFSHPYRTIFNFRIGIYSINSLINSLSVNHWQVIGRTIWRRLTSLYNLSSIIWQEFWWSKHLSNLLNKTMWILFTLLMLGSK